MEDTGGFGVASGGIGGGGIREGVGAQVGVAIREGGEKGKGRGRWEGSEKDIQEEDVRFGNGGEEAECVRGGGGTSKVGEAAKEGGDGDEIGVVGGEDGVGKDLVEMAEGSGGGDETLVEGPAVAADGGVGGVGPEHGAMQRR
ncbi:hypothetical protein Cni_G22668 [Canna indica]|uniref:Uncharacterized protein n=1 Tax=Canna indica TaxID=4628 RepID=A0AAQ3QLD9_9LILI|nr:hypothetical protein Cni_G22668 [Canna indica]